MNAASIMATDADAPRDELQRARRRAYQDQLLARLVGKKVSLSTRDFHHVVGRLVELVPGTSLDDERLRLSVAGREVLVARAGLARIHEADPALAEYTK